MSGMVVWLFAGKTVKGNDAERVLTVDTLGYTVKNCITVIMLMGCYRIDILDTI